MERVLSDEVANALNQAASMLWEQGLIREAEALVRKTLAIWERTLGSHASGNSFGFSSTSREETLCSFVSGFPVLAAVKYIILDSSDHARAPSPVPALQI